MAKLRSNLSDAKEFENLPNDWYTVHISKYEYGNSKASVQRGQPEAMFTFSVTVDEGEHAGREVDYFTVSLSPKAAGLREQFYDAIGHPRTCLECGTEFTSAKRVSKEESKLNKAGLACPNCDAQGETEVDVGDPEGSIFLGARCLARIEPEKSIKPGDTRSYDRVKEVLPIK